MTDPSFKPPGPPVVERIAGRVDAHVGILCEHASNALPGGYAWHASDAWLRETHWAWDPWAAVVTRAVAQELLAPAVLAGFSSLLADPNRPEDSPGLLRDEAEGKAIHLNRGVSSAERTRRLQRFHRPFHQAAGEMAASLEGSNLLSVHTFTPVYEGKPRTLEVGVLWEREDSLNEALGNAFSEAGFVTGLNEPYSGKEGLAYSVERHAQTHGLRAMEVELRQDCCADPAFRRRVVDVLVRFLRACV